MNFADTTKLLLSKIGNNPQARKLLAALEDAVKERDIGESPNGPRYHYIHTGWVAPIRGGRKHMAASRVPVYRKVANPKRAGRYKPGGPNPVLGRASTTRSVFRQVRKTLMTE